ncbi:RIP metalloprotease RseP [Myxococcus sp. K15C18031901]|uniref:RIP metalloprotease RseP n=1 Tax=Myxococcus dinghuensis TaxID=2906761 RepID=UPI0020A76865|nr:RIP metalloprotease RseP [Myxococcus dinghuensis]MCP3097734.1 RIP metalloprotease RseP [Myxococcus dinghuensis]
MFSLQGIGAFLLLLGVLVTVHELGHFLVAKACGVKVLKFSIGFGPKLVGFTKGETEYQIALLPLGGYVKMAGDLPHEELDPKEASRGFLAQPPWKRGLIVLAGPAFNFIFPVLVYFFVFISPHQTTSTLVSSLDPGMPAALGGVQPGDRVTSVDGVAVRSFEDMRDAFEGRFERPIPLVVERDGKPLTLTVTPRKTVETSVIDTVERGMIGVYPAPFPPTVGVPQGSAAQAAGLRTFDRVLSINGVHVADEVALYRELNHLPEGTPLKLVVRRMVPVDAGAVTGAMPEVVEATMARQPGTGLAALGAESSNLYIGTVFPGSAAARAGLQAGDRILSLNGEKLESFSSLQARLSTLKEEPFTLSWRGADGAEQTQRLTQARVEFEDVMGNKSSPLILGAARYLPPSADRGFEDKVSIQYSPGEALRRASLRVPQLIAQTVKSLGGLFVGTVPLDQLGGPVMMAQLAARTAAMGSEAFLDLMGAISINLGVVNLLPIPILDGFALLAAVWEGIRRRPIPVRVREVANMVGLALLFLLMLLVFKNDLTR